MDAAAQCSRRHLERQGITDALNPWFPSEPRALFFQGEKQSRLALMMLDNTITAPPSSWSTGTAKARNMIDWQGLGEQ
jgi:hypothetical protein